MLIEDKRDGIRFFISRAFSGRRGAVHGFLGRTGGFSPPPYDTLNLDLMGEDPADNIRRNKDAVSRSLGFPAENLVTLNQVHGSKVIIVDDRYLRTVKGRQDADALVTALPGVPLGILTADCVPILMYDRARRVAAAVHAGWRGTLDMAVVKTVEAMGAGFGSRPGDIAAAVGPRIGPCCYTVKEDVRASFRDSFGDKADGFFIESEDIRLDLGKANADLLLSAGLKPTEIEMRAPCTSCMKELFFSYRRDKGATGRQLSFIMLTDS